jgi:hypothetical protein
VAAPPFWRSLSPPWKLHVEKFLWNRTCRRLAQAYTYEELIKYTSSSMHWPELEVGNSELNCTGHRGLYVQNILEDNHCAGAQPERAII